MRSSPKVPYNMMGPSLKHDVINLLMLTNQFKQYHYGNPIAVTHGDRAGNGDKAWRGLTGILCGHGAPKG